MHINISNTSQRECRNVYILIVSNFISGLGTTIFSFALSLYVLDLTGSASTFALMLSTSSISKTISNIAAGGFVDKHNKKKIIVSTDLLSGIVVFLFFIGFYRYPQNTNLIFCTNVLISIIQSIFWLSINSSIALFTSEDNISKVNASFATINSIRGLLGPILGAVSYKILGMKFIIIINALSFIISGFIEMFLILRSNDVKNNKPRSISNHNLKIPFEYISQNNGFKFLIVLAGIIQFFFIPMYQVLLPYICYKVIQVNEFQLGLIQASMAIGISLGAIYVSMKKKSISLLKKFFILLNGQAILFILWSLVELLFIATNNKWLITGVFFLLLTQSRALNIIQTIPVYSYFQMEIPESIRARVISIAFTIIELTVPIGMWLYGFLLGKISWVIIVISTGIISLLISIFTSRHRYFKELLYEINRPKI